jgi:hypothetical protein
MSGTLADRWLRTVPGIPTATLRARFLRSELSDVTLDEIGPALEQVAAMTEQAHPIAREVLAAVMPTLNDPEFRGQVSALRAYARRASLLALARLLRKRVHERVPQPAVDETMLPTSSDGRVLTLGERKALARRPDRFALDRLLRDPDPTVIRNVLANPRITENDVVRMAARRPAYPDTIQVIACHPEWASRARVRMAIVQNPYTPPDISVPMVRLLIRPELRQLVDATDIPPVVRAAAVELLERRPPVPEPPEPGASH